MELGEVSFWVEQTWGLYTPIVTCGRRGDTDDESVEVQLS
jgi:hypothetical protein